MANADWFWTDPYAEFTEPKGQPSPFDKLKPDNKLDWWKSKARDWKATPKSTLFPEGMPTSKQDMFRQLGYGEDDIDDIMNWSRQPLTPEQQKLMSDKLKKSMQDFRKTFQNDMDAKYGKGNWKATGLNDPNWKPLKPLSQRVPGSILPGAGRDVGEQFMDNMKKKGINPQSGYHPNQPGHKNRMEFYDTSSQYGREMQAARESTFADDLYQMMHKAKQPRNWVQGGKNLIKRFGPSMGKMIKEGVAVGAADITGGAVGRQLGKTPLMTDPNTTYDQFYEDMFRGQIDFDRANRAPWVNQTGFPSPNLGAI